MVFSHLAQRHAPYFQLLPAALLVAEIHRGSLSYMSAHVLLSLLTLSFMNIHAKLHPL